MLRAMNCMLPSALTACGASAQAPEAYTIDIDGATMQYRAPDTAAPAVATAGGANAQGAQGVVQVNTTHPAAVAINVAPAILDVYPLHKRRSTATFQGTYPSAVDWSADSGTNAWIELGTIDWTAPMATGNYRLMATTRADPDVSQGVSQAVRRQVPSPPLVIWCTPSLATVSGGSVVAIYGSFSSNETPGIDASVTWSSGGGSRSSRSDGVVHFSASTRGVYTVQAQSNSYPSVFAVAQVTVQ